MSSTLDLYRTSLLSGSIRLLRLLPHKDKTAHIHCELFHYPLIGSNTETHLYDAISYVWGGPAKTRSIFIREQDATSEHSLPVTKNLHEVLTRLRNPYLERIIWIDAVCINQVDDREKEQQIRLMVEIYGQANNVFVRLGEAADDSDRALQSILIAGEDLDKPEDVLNENIFEQASNHQAITELLRRPWFQRIWVLQEVAAARHIRIACGATEIDGYAFCLGLEKFEKFNKSRGHSSSSAPPVNYLIKGSINRPNFSMTRKANQSLDICSLGQLMDMYHTHKATKHHDKVYALLGMCSDDLSDVGLSPDYSIPWEDVLQRVMNYLLGKTISVQTWGGDSEFVAIKTKGCILGKVWFSGMSQETEGIGINFWSRGKVFFWTIRTSAKSIKEGDLVCLLEGASSPSIIRPHNDFFDIIIVAAARLPKGFPVQRNGRTFNRNFLLVWGWESSSYQSQGPVYYERLVRTRTRVLSRSINTEDHLDKVVRIWNMAQMWADVQEEHKAEEKVEEAVKEYELAQGIERYTTKGQYEVKSMRNRFRAAIRQLLEKGEAEIESYSNGRQYGRMPPSWAPVNGSRAAVNLDEKDEDEWAPLFWAAENGYRAVVKLLLETGKVNINATNQDKQTALSLAAENGHEVVVELLLETGRVNVNAKDQYGQTPLQWAAENGHAAVVKLLLETGKVDINAQDRYGQTPLQWAVEYKHKGVVKLLLETGKLNFNLEGQDGWKLLLWAAENGYDEVVKVLLEIGHFDLNARDDYGRTPLQYAEENGHEAVIRLLRSDASHSQQAPSVLFQSCTGSRVTFHGHQRQQPWFNVVEEGGNIRKRKRCCLGILEEEEFFGGGELHWRGWIGKERVLKEAETMYRCTYDGPPNTLGAQINVG